MPVPLDVDSWVWLLPHHCPDRMKQGYRSISHVIYDTSVLWKSILVIWERDKAEENDTIPGKACDQWEIIHTAKKWKDVCLFVMIFCVWSYRHFYFLTGQIGFCRFVEVQFNSRFMRKKIFSSQGFRTWLSIHFKIFILFLYALVCVLISAYMYRCRRRPEEGIVWILCSWSARWLWVTCCGPENGTWVL